MQEQTDKPVTGSAEDAAKPTRTWEHWTEIPGMVFYPLFLKRTVVIALVVGTILFTINHIDEVIMHRTSRAMWIKGAITYIVPFAVSNMGLLVGARRRKPQAHSHNADSHVEQMPRVEYEAALSEEK
ncbi:MAG: nitrate/nitrite transporter NrtS [Candidatus Sulfotelmatobacter sp.]